MATSVKVDEETKSRLEELQARIKLETGRKVTQQALLRRLVEHGMASDAVVESFRGSAVPLSDEEIAAYMSYTFASDEPIDEADIDRILYDEEQL